MADLRVVQNAYRNYEQRKAAAVSWSLLLRKLRNGRHAVTVGGELVYCICLGLWKRKSSVLPRPP